MASVYFCFSFSVFFVVSTTGAPLAKNHGNHMQQSSIIDLSYQGSDAVQRKLSQLSDVQATVNSLFSKASSDYASGSMSTEIFNQLRSRCSDKIHNLKFMLANVERLVSERNQLERISSIFNNLAFRRTNETDLLVNQIHMTASELSDSIKLDLGRVVDVVGGSSLLGFNPLSNPFSPLRDILNKIDLNPFKKFTI